MFRVGMCLCASITLSLCYFALYRFVALSLCYPLSITLLPTNKLVGYYVTVPPGPYPSLPFTLWPFAFGPGGSAAFLSAPL